MKLGGNYPVTRPCVNSTVLYCEMCGATKVNPSPGLDPIISIFVDKLPRRTQLVHEAALSRARIEATTEAFEDEDSHVRVYPPAGLGADEIADIEAKLADRFIDIQIEKGVFDLWRGLRLIEQDKSPVFFFPTRYDWLAIMRGQAPTTPLV